jgi:CubicO group peptidase (beta-lactamase class C family)
MLTGMQWSLIYSSTGSVTQQVNIAPQGAVAQISLGQADGGGLLDSGIRGFAGGGGVVDFGDNFYNWPNTVFDLELSSVTFALALGQNQEATGVCNILFWSP